MLEKTLLFSKHGELIRMMNRKLAHGRHLEWGLRVNEQCNPQEAFDGESGQRKQRSELREPIEQWLPASNDSLVSVVRHTIDGIWPDTMAAMV
jgi:hypothetical protein